MSKLLALLLILAVSLAIAVVWSRQHQTQSMPMIQAAHPIAKSNLLFTPRPLTPKNIPLNRERTT